MWNSATTTRSVGNIFTGLFAVALLVIQINIWQVFPEWIAISIFKI